MEHFAARVLSNRQIAESWRELVIDWPAQAPEPGQFLTVRASPRFDPLLRRPFAFAGFSRERCEASVIYQVRGEATRLLADLAAGARLDTIGPLGRAFPPPGKGERALLAGGGIGLGPVLFLAREFARRKREGVATGEDGLSPALACFGFRTAASVPAIEWPEGVRIYTDDGSAGFAGTPSSALAEEDAGPGRARIYACGPAAMLAALAALAKSRGWNASLSAEQWMACGVGACMGCALERADGAGFLRACADGPVFERDDIDWAAEAARAAR